MIHYLKSIPVTLMICFIALLTFSFPDTASWLDYQTNLNPLEQISQLFGCHLLHWSGEHLFWDLGMFALLGTICERINRRGFLLVLFWSAILIPPIVSMCHPAIETYRGLSGIDTALFGMSAIHFGVEKLRERDKAGLLVYAGLFFAMVVKIAHEFVSGSTVFVESSQFAPVPIAHVVGAALGTIAGLARLLSHLELPRGGETQIPVRR